MLGFQVPGCKRWSPGVSNSILVPCPFLFSHFKPLCLLTDWQISSRLPRLFGSRCHGPVHSFLQCSTIDLTGRGFSIGGHRCTSFGVSPGATQVASLWNRFSPSSRETFFSSHSQGCFPCSCLFCKVCVCLNWWLLGLA